MISHPLVRRYLVDLWSQRWIVLALLWTVCIVGWVIVARLPDQYTSSARIFVDTRSVLQPLMKGLTVESDISSQVEIMRQTLLTRPNLQRLMRMTDLDLQIASPADEEDMVARLQQEIQVEAERKDLFSISYTSPDPVLAQRVVESLLTIFVEQNVGTSRRDIENAQQFLNRQIEDYERRLREAEARTAAFRQEHSNQLNDRVTLQRRRDSLEMKIRDLETQLGTAQWKRDQLRVQLASVPRELSRSTAQLAPNSPAGQRLLALQQELESLRTRYTDQHPSVILLKRQIEAAEQALDGETAGPDGSGGMQASNPVYAQLQSELRGAELEINALQRQLQRAQEELQQVRIDLEQVPEFERQLAELNRDYEILRGQYTELVSRRESAALAGKMESETNSVEFRVVEPPVVPIKPSGPNRLLLSAGVFAAALGAGLGWSLVHQQLSSSFAGVGDLRDRIGLPVLGSVSRVSAAEATLRQRVQMAMIVLLILGLFVAFAAFNWLLPGEIVRTTAANTGGVSGLLGSGLGWG